MRTLGQFIGVLLLVGFVGAYYFWWIVAAAALVVAVLVTGRLLRAGQAEAAELAARNAELAAAQFHGLTYSAQSQRECYGQGWLRVLT